MKNTACGQVAADVSCLQGHRPAGEACAMMEVEEMGRWERRWHADKARDRAQA